MLHLPVLHLLSWLTLKGMECRANFSIILYGVGCKRAMLAQFAEQRLTEGGLVEINAWRGKLSAKQIVVAVLSSLSGMDPKNFR